MKKRMYLHIVEICARLLDGRHGIARIMNHEPETTLSRAIIHTVADWALTRYYAAWNNERKTGLTEKGDEK